MLKLINHIQNYAWGSTTALTELYGIANPDHRPMAELWMGAHPSCSSKVLIDGKEIELTQLIARNKNAYLGEHVAEKFAQLPFLFKVLCAGQPLSIQVHPNKAAAEKGYAREQQAKIPLNAPNRNYKDPNHKPELVYALTPFLAMNGFRPLTEIAQLMASVKEADPAIADFIANPSQQKLAVLFSRLLSLKNQQLEHALAILQQSREHNHGQPWDSIKYIAQFYPKDCGLFAPLLLNVVTLKPGEAMFLYAETPHAYLHGSALEVMANSDNVLRAGLTPKYIDVAELLANLKFEAKETSDLLMPPIIENDSQFYPIPVDDFAFSLHQINGKSCLSQRSVAVIFCLSGDVMLDNHKQHVMLSAGESCFIAANESPLTINGQGQIARVYNQ